MAWIRDRHSDAPSYAKNPPVACNSHLVACRDDNREPNGTLPAQLLPVSVARNCAQRSITGFRFS